MNSGKAIVLKAGAPALASSRREDAPGPELWRPALLGVASAWYGHVPFAFWLVAQTRPQLIVELGTHNGVSYSAFCQAVERLELPARCFAVDTWKGDRHAGEYGEEVFDSLMRFHERYRSFSTLLRMTFEQAVDTFADGSIDLLHIDGEHGYEAVRRDFESWKPKLSARGVVLFHDTNVREREFGVWRLWDELRGRYPSFEFVHASGLGVLAVGPKVPAGIGDLCGLAEPEEIGLIRERFAVLGERWEMEVRYCMTLADAETISRALANTAAERDAAEVNLQKARVGLERARRGIKQLEGELAASRTYAIRMEQECDAIRNSTIWRVMKPVRGAAKLVPPPVRRAVREILSRRPRLRTFLRGVRAMADQRVRLEPKTGLLFVSGEPDTPGHDYRVLQYQQAAAAAGAEARWMTVSQAAESPDAVQRSLGVIIWRARHNSDLAGVIKAGRRAGAQIVLDVDDLMFRPELATLGVIDGIRSQGLTEPEVEAHFRDILQTMAAADLCTCPTDELARHIREFQKPALVHPNGFTSAQQRLARMAVRRRAQAPPDGLIRIGYAGGSRTHQRDFEVVAEVLADLLARRPECRLVLFESPDRVLPLLDIEEFPALATRSEQIEWRRMVPVERLPEELARFDVNIAPLELGNPFCEAKSELKFFEAALVDLPTIASPTGPFTRAIRDGDTGYLAGSAEDWSRHLTALLDDAELRRRIGRAAYRQVVWRYGPARRAELMRSMLAQLKGGADAARAFELELRRNGLGDSQAPALGQAKVVFSADKLGEAAATVVIPLHNYAGYVIEALESVRKQTLPLVDLVVIDDASTDDSLHVTDRWVRAHAERFNRVMVLQHSCNAGLAITRNTGFDAAETEFALPLDADNRLLPNCLEACLSVAQTSGAGFVYPRIRYFGGSSEVIGGSPYQPARFVGGNYIDAMALVSKWAWAAVGGYRHIRNGWEDYDFWCRCVERGMFGAPAEEVLAEYRVHEASMLRTATDLTDNKIAIIREMEQHHSWLSVTGPR